ncbi:hypothetical protein PoB_002636800 [Plakobranchus ocellatus]|uniref:Uncharacterized protein n=1 Tax=Plakobranchus ocellatus TaxID=259542 RepID=A0AAV3ZZP9_9GAST|nr:hypothetical protein PoB_002636800 [Plakobranchus ocellatus]
MGNCFKNNNINNINNDSSSSSNNNGSGITTIINNNIGIHCNIANGYSGYNYNTLDWAWTLLPRVPESKMDSSIGEAACRDLSLGLSGSNATCKDAISYKKRGINVAQLISN